MWASEDTTKPWQSKHSCADLGQRLHQECSPLAPGTVGSSAVPTTASISPPTGDCSMGPSSDSPIPKASEASSVQDQAERLMQRITRVFTLWRLRLASSRAQSWELAAECDALERTLDIVNRSPLFKLGDDRCGEHRARGARAELRRSRSAPNHAGIASQAVATALHNSDQASIPSGSMTAPREQRHSSMSVGSPFMPQSRADDALDTRSICATPRSWDVSQIPCATSPGSTHQAAHGVHAWKDGNMRLAAELGPSPQQLSLTLSPSPSRASATASISVWTPPPARAPSAGAVGVSTQPHASQRRTVAVPSAHIASVSTPPRASLRSADDPAKRTRAVWGAGCSPRTPNAAACAELSSASSSRDALDIGESTPIGTRWVASTPSLRRIAASSSAHPRELCVPSTPPPHRASSLWDEIGNSATRPTCLPAPPRWREESTDESFSEESKANSQIEIHGVSRDVRSGAAGESEAAASAQAMGPHGAQSIRLPRPRPSCLPCAPAVARQPVQTIAQSIVAERHHSCVNSAGPREQEQHAVCVDPQQGAPAVTMRPRLSTVGTQLPAAPAQTDTVGTCTLPAPREVDVPSTPQRRRSSARGGPPRKPSTVIRAVSPGQSVHPSDSSPSKPTRSSQCFRGGPAAFPPSAADQPYNVSVEAPVSAVHCEAVEWCSTAPVVQSSSSRAVARKSTSRRRQGATKEEPPPKGSTVAGPPWAEDFGLASPPKQLGLEEELPEASVEFEVRARNRRAASQQTGQAKAQATAVGLQQPSARTHMVEPQRPSVQAHMAALLTPELVALSPSAFAPDGPPFPAPDSHDSGRTNSPIDSSDPNQRLSCGSDGAS